MGIKRAISIYLALIAVATTVQFAVWTIYAKTSDRANDLANTIWNVLGWCMLAGLVLMLVTTFREKQRIDADPSTSAQHCCTPNVLFYGAVLLTLAFLPNWFAARFGQVTNESTFWTVWYFIDTVVPVLFAVEALRLWRASDRPAN